MTATLKLRNFVLSTFVFLAANFVDAQASQPQPAFQMTILHTNDLHAHDESFRENGNVVGGMARLGHAIRDLKKKDKNVVVVDCGDIFQGSPLYSLKRGEVEVNLLDKIGYDIATIGNHEFDDGPQNLAKQLKLANYQIVCANLDFSAVPSLDALIKPSVIKEIGGEEVGFIGAITPGISQGSITLGGVKVKSPADWMAPIAQEISKLKAKGVNKIVVLSHCGIQDDRKMAEALLDVDVIVGGHSHTRLDTPEFVDHKDGSSTIIVQTGCYGRALGELLLSFDAGGKIQKQQSKEELIDITETIGEEPDLKEYIHHEAAPLVAMGRVVVAQATQPFGQNFNDCRWDSPIGDLLCDALYEEAKKCGAQIALQNRGGIRSHIESGPITLKAIDAVLPFDNTLVVATISGSTLLKSIENGLSGFLGARFLEVHGLKIGYEPAKPAGEKIAFALVQDRTGVWLPIDPASDYRVAINSYNFKSGEGHDFSKATDIQYCEIRLSSVFEHYLAARRQLTPQPPNRIVPLTAGLLSHSNAGGQWIIHVKGVPPHSKLMLGAGSGRGVDCAADGIPLPLSECKLIATGEADDAGVWNSKISPGFAQWIAVAAIPPGNSMGVLISYPVAVK